MIGWAGVLLSTHYSGMYFAASHRPKWDCPRRTLMVCDARSVLIATVSCERNTWAWQWL